MAYSKLGFRERRAIEDMLHAKMQLLHSCHSDITQHF